MTTTKKHIVKRVAEKVGERRDKVSQILDAVLAEFGAALAAGGRIELRDFGIFIVVRRKARLARNPRTGEAVQVPERSVVKFKPGKLLKKRVSKGWQGED